MPSLGLRQYGFSILELMIALSISSILLVLAVPSMQSFMGDSEISATSNHFVHSLQTARSEAIKRAGPVGLCPSKDPLADEPVCSGSNYAKGWIVFLDEDGNGTRETTDTVVIQAKELSTGFAITQDSVFDDRIYFSESGTSTNEAGVPLSGSVQIEYVSDEKRDISIAANGRISTVDPDA